MSPNLIGHIEWLWDPVCIDIYVSKMRLTFGDLYVVERE